MYLLATDTTADQIARGVGNAIVAIPKAIWRTHPHSPHGPYHTAYAVTWTVLVIIVIAGVLRFLSTR